MLAKRVLMIEPVRIKWLVSLRWLKPFAAERLCSLINWPMPICSMEKWRAAV